MIFNRIYNICAFVLYTSILQKHCHGLVILENDCGLQNCIENAQIWYKDGFQQPKGIYKFNGNDLLANKYITSSRKSRALLEQSENKLRTKRTLEKESNLRSYGQRRRREDENRSEDKELRDSGGNKERGGFRSRSKRDRSNGFREKNIKRRKGRKKVFSNEGKKLESKTKRFRGTKRGRRRGRLQRGKSKRLKFRHGRWKGNSTIPKAEGRRKRRKLSKNILKRLKCGGKCSRMRNRRRNRRRSRKLNRRCSRWLNRKRNGGSRKQKRRNKRRDTLKSRRRNKWLRDRPRDYFGTKLKSTEFNALIPKNRTEQIVIFKVMRKVVDQCEYLDYKLRMTRVMKRLRLSLSAADQRKAGKKKITKQDKSIFTKYMTTHEDSLLVKIPPFLAFLHPNCVKSSETIPKNKDVGRKTTAIGMSTDSERKHIARRDQDIDHQKHPEYDTRDNGDIVSYMKSREYWGNMAVKAKNVDNSEISTTGSQTSGNKNNVFRGAPMTEKSKHL